MKKIMTLKRLVILALLAPIFGLSACAPGTPEAGGREVAIRYSGESLDQIGENRPAENYVYLVLNLTIENKGYSAFSTNPARFYVVINRISYDPALISYPEELKTFALPDGKKTSGKIVFEVPSTYSSFGYEPGYSAFPERINVQWVKA